MHTRSVISMAPAERTLQSMRLLKSQLAESLPTGAARPCYRPRYIAITCLAADRAAAPFFAAAWLALNSCNQVGAVEARFAYCASLCFVTQTSLHSRYIPRYSPNPSPGLLELRRRALHTALCFASSQTSLHRHYIPCCRPNPSPCQRHPFLPWLGFVLAVANFKLELRRRALRAVLVLKSCDFRAGSAALR